MKNWSLQRRITILVGCITLLACTALTANSILSADNYYGVIFMQGQEDETLILADEEVPLVTADSPDYQLVTKQFSRQILGVMALILFFSLILTYYVTGRVLRPLTELTQSIQDINQENLHERVVLPKATGEVRQLTQSFNGMLGRLEESFAVQKQFASNAAHELRTPLAVMKASLQVLELDEQPSYTDYQEFVGDIKESIERLIRTVDNLLALTRNTYAEKPEQIVLAELLEQVGEEFSQKASELCVNITIQSAAQTVLTNRTLLYRAVCNLVENALKYNHTGGTVTVKVLEKEKQLGILVSDTGSGMNTETLQHIFEPFYRADLSRSQEIPGSGLGLSIVKIIADLLEGSIEIKSEPGHGTEAAFWLPKKIGQRKKRLPSTYW